jgi:hypothetical protein
MRKHIYSTLLIISLLFNLAFVSFYAYKSIEMRRFKPFPPPPREDRMDPNFRKMFRPELGDLRLKNFELRKQLFELLRSSNPDYKRADSVADSLIESQNEIETKITKHFIETRKGLNNKEAELFYGRLVDHSNRGCMRIKNKKEKSWKSQ